MADMIKYHDKHFLLHLLDSIFQSIFQLYSAYQ